MTEGFQSADSESSDSESKYGSPLTGSDWVGLPLREGSWSTSGAVSDLCSQHDSVLLWTGGPSQVTLTSRGACDDAPKQHHFKRSGGMIDLLPRQTHLENIDWNGRASTCVSVTFPTTCVRALTEVTNMGLCSAQGPQFCVTDSHIADLIQRLHANASGVQNLGAVYVQSLSLALVSYVTARYGVAAKPREEGGGSFSRAQRQSIEDFVEKHLSVNFGLVDLARLASYSPDHFARLFKRSFGLSPHKYVSGRRVERARAMLLDRDLTISQVALACGFSSQAHLGDVFKRQVGLTPGAFRRQSSSE